MTEEKLVTLITDFGTEDGYVGQMKGVILSQSPGAEIIDISHKITPQNINQAAFVCYMTYRYFPKGTVHMIVVDPEVGTQREALLVIAGGYKFIAPDNGVLAFIYSENQNAEVYKLDKPAYFLPDISNTFHGRDVFAPVVAHVLNGVVAAELGTLYAEYQRGEINTPTVEQQHITGSIQYIDHFGNLVTNIPESLVCDKWHAGQIYARMNEQNIGPMVGSYAVQKQGMPLLIVGSHGFLEIAVSMGNARQYFNARVGDQVKVYG